jgi:trans-aconitate methyltransferase
VIPDRRELAAVAEHWDSAYRGGPTEVSWYETEPSISLSLISLLGISADAAAIDIGGGGSPLASRLLDRSFTDVTVLDISTIALDETKQQTRGDPRVRCLQRDLLSWEPDRRYGLWHDRAYFHFLIDDEDRRAYLRALRRAVEAGGSVIVATFAPDGPDRCSGLPVHRYSTQELSRALGNHFQLVESKREEHFTPSGSVQPFTWVAGRIAD